MQFLVPVESASRLELTLMLLKDFPNCINTTHTNTKRLYQLSLVVTKMAAAKSFSTAGSLAGFIADRHLQHATNRRTVDAIDGMVPLIVCGDLLQHGDKRKKAECSKSKC